jgi:RNA polymerase-binding transcription factor DksA
MEQATRSQVATLRHFLSNRLETLRTEIDVVMPVERVDAAVQEVASHADQSVEQQDEELVDAQLQRDLDELRLVQAALQRLDGTGYGECIDCGADIPTQRLLAQPAAERCLACQSVFELAQRRWRP